VFFVLKIRYYPHFPDKSAGQKGNYIPEFSIPDRGNDDKYGFCFFQIGGRVAERATLPICGDAKKDVDNNQKQSIMLLEGQRKSKN
jgi:hypothetical protein